jgi:hypothetical protein
VVVDAGKGTVTVRVPGSAAFVPLADAANLPVGTVIDSRRGTVVLAAALPGGKQQTGTFSGGLFEVRQAAGARGMTDLYLRGAMPRCSSRRTVASAARKRTARRLWARDKGGRFRTHGANSVATVRGTRWLTEDRCAGTLTRVSSGAVDVRDKWRGTTRRVRAGHAILVPPKQRRSA